MRAEYSRTDPPTGPRSLHPPHRGAGVVNALDPAGVFLRLLAGERPEPQTRYLEIRYRTARGLRQEFFAADRLEDLSARALWLGQRTDTYIGVVTRTSRCGKKHAVGSSHLVWCEIDAPDAAQRLAAAPIAPLLTIASGTAGHLHAYWSLDRPVDTGTLERANLALVTLLGGDRACTDAGRIMRIPGTLNFKHKPPQPVRLASYNIRYQPVALEQLTGGTPPARRTARPSPSVLVPASVPGSVPAGESRDRTRALKLIPGREWARVLLGVEPGADGKIACPFHAGGRERTASLQLYTDGTWFCYACRQGGSVIDFASKLWQLPPRGSSFLEIRDRLSALLARPPHEQAAKAPTTR